MVMPMINCIADSNAVLGKKLGKQYQLPSSDRKCYGAYLWINRSDTPA